MDFGTLIKNRRTELGLTLEQVGDHCGVGKSTVRKWEKGLIRNVRRDKIYLLAEILRISPMDLLDCPADDPVVSDADWDPASMGAADHDDESIRIMTRGMRAMSPEDRARLVDMARLMFGQDFDEKGNKR